MKTPINCLTGAEMKRNLRLRTTDMGSLNHHFKKHNSISKFATDDWQSRAKNQLKVHERPKPLKRNEGDQPTLLEQAPIVTRDERIKPIKFMDSKGCG